MIHASTGRFHYEVDVDSISELRTRLRDQYDELLGVALKHQEDRRLDRPLQNRLLKALAWSEDNLDAIDEAIEPLSEEHKLGVLLLFQQLISEASAIGHAHAITEASRELFSAGAAHARAARTSPQREAAITAAILKCKAGTIKPAHWVSAFLEKEGISLKPETIKERMKQLGVWQTLRDAAIGSGRPSSVQDDTIP